MKNEENLFELVKEKAKQEVGFLNIGANRKNTKIQFENILYIESLGDFVKIYAQESSTVITRERISKLKVKLLDNFIRIHRSFIVNKHHVASFNKEFVLINDSELPISRSFKIEAYNLLN